MQLQVSNPIYVDVEQNTDEWLEARIGRATASKFSDIMANGRGGAESVGAKNYRAQLVAERLSGNREETYKSSSMLWGTETEPTARLQYELRSGNDAEESGIFLHDTLLAGASPDGLIGDDGLLEIKCPNTATHIETLRKQQVPPVYYWQVMGQLWITGREWCDFVSFDPRLPANAQYFCTRVFRDEEKIAELADKVAEFLNSVELEINFVKNYKG